MGDAWRLAFGTLTRVPVPAPRVVNAATARGAMLIAPFVGLLLGAAAGLVAWGLATVAPAGTSLVVALLVLALLAWLTRALHLDGLADTADALGSGRPAEQALAIARRSDIGPFGVVTLALVLGLQAAALASVLDRGNGPWAVAAAVVAGRIALAWACTPLLPPARPDGLGAVVTGTVPAWAAGAWTLLLVAALAWQPWWLAAAGAAALVSGLLLRTARRRLGGVTGDVLGATVEVATTAFLVAAALVP